MSNGIGTKGAIMLNKQKKCFNFLKDKFYSIFLRTVFLCVLFIISFSVELHSQDLNNKEWFDEVKKNGKLTSYVDLSKASLFLPSDKNDSSKNNEQKKKWFGEIQKNGKLGTYIELANASLFLPATKENNSSQKKQNDKWFEEVKSNGKLKSYIDLSNTYLFLPKTKDDSPIIKEAKNKWLGEIEFGGKLGNHRDLADASLFLPMTQDKNSLLYLSIRGQIDEFDNSEGNWGLGYREILPNNKWILGGYSYFDALKSENDNVFKQLTFGFELLSTKWDFRSNFYFAENKEQSIKGTENQSSNIIVDQHDLYMLTNQEAADAERPMSGADFEVGYKLPQFEDARLFAGGYFFTTFHDSYEEMSGARVRLDAHAMNVDFISSGANIRLGVDAQYDNIRDEQIFAVAKLKIPLNMGKTPRQNRLTELEKRMTSIPVRDIDIVVNKKSVDEVHTLKEELIESDSGKIISDVYFVDSEGNGDGTIENPGNLENANIAFANNDNTLIVLDGSAGAFVNGSGGISDLSNIELKDHTYIGGGAPITFNTDSGKIINVNFSGEKPVFNGAINIKGQNAELKHIDIKLDSTSPVQAITLNNARDFTLSDVNFVASEDANIYELVSLYNSKNIKIDNMTYDQTASNLYKGVSAYNSTIDITNSKFSTGEIDRAFYYAGDDSTININNSEVVSSDDIKYGIEVNNATVNFENSEIRSKEDINRGAYLRYSTLNMSNNSVIEAKNISEGINAGYNSTLNVANSKIAADEKIGSAISVRDSVLNVTDNSMFVANNLDMGIDSRYSTATIKDSTIDAKNNISYGVFATGGNVNIENTDFVVGNNMSIGVQSYGRSNTIDISDSNFIVNNVSDSIFYAQGGKINASNSSIIAENDIRYGVFIDSDTAIVNINNVDFSAKNNISTAIYSAYGGTIDVADVTFSAEGDIERGLRSSYDNVINANNLSILAGKSMNYGYDIYRKSHINATNTTISADSGINTAIHFLDNNNSLILNGGEITNYNNFVNDNTLISNDFSYTNMWRSNTVNVTGDTSFSKTP